MLSDKEKEAIEKFERLIKYFNDWDTEYTIIPEDKKYYETILNLIDKKDKVIDLMAKEIYNYSITVTNETTEEIKEYFYKKVEEENV